MKFYSHDIFCYEFCSLIPIFHSIYLQVVDGVCALKSRVYSGDDESAALLHRYDFEWLLEAVVKVLFTDRLSPFTCVCFSIASYKLYVYVLLRHWFSLM